MEDNDFRESIQAMLAEQKRKNNESNKQYAQRTCHVASPYAPSRSAPPPPTAPPNDGKDVRIQDLTEQNQKLTKQYADLVKKANTLVEAYRELKAENETLKKKKAKRDSVTQVFSKVGKTGNSVYEKIILWFKT